jgi:hypothetical protein
MKNYPATIKPFDNITNEFVFVLRNLYSKSGFDDEMELEINRKFVMEYVASFEAKTVYYFRNIAKRKTIKNDANIPAQVKKTIKNNEKYLMLTHIEAIFLSILQPLDNSVYADFLSLAKYRNWLAHGRGWDYDGRWDKFDLPYSVNTISAVLNLITDYPNDLKN